MDGELVINITLTSGQNASLALAKGYAERYEASLRAVLTNPESHILVFTGAFTDVKGSYSVRIGNIQAIRVHPGWAVLNVPRYDTVAIVRPSQDS